MHKVEPECGGDNKTGSPKDVPPQSVYWDPAAGPGQGAQPTVIVIEQPDAGAIPRSDSNRVNFRSDSVHVICHVCDADVWTRTTAKLGNAVWGSVFMACLMGLILGCCLLPFCVRPLKDTAHFCPKCKTKIGLYEVVKF